jgi:hypothetical protein
MQAAQVPAGRTRLVKDDMSDKAERIPGTAPPAELFEAQMCGCHWRRAEGYAARARRQAAGDIAEGRLHDEVAKTTAAALAISGQPGSPAATGPGPCRAQQRPGGMLAAGSHDPRHAGGHPPGITTR